MGRRWEARPRAVAATGRAGNSGRALTRNCRGNSSTDWPAALSLDKRGKPCTVAKVVPLDGEPVLAMVNREQRGVASVLSVPAAALEYAERAGCRWFYFRRDKTAQMWRLPLADLRRVGWLKTSCGLPEWFCPLAKMQRTAWRAWPYAEKVVHLEGLPSLERGPEQLDLFGGAA